LRRGLVFSDNLLNRLLRKIFSSTAGPSFSRMVGASAGFFRGKCGLQIANKTRVVVAVPAVLPLDPLLVWA